MTNKMNHLLESAPQFGQRQFFVMTSFPMWCNSESVRISKWISKSKQLKIVILNMKKNAILTPEYDFNYVKSA